jgi:hypothetical protein
MDLPNTYTLRHRTLSVRGSLGTTTLARVTTGAICCLLVACVAKAPPPPPENRCPPNRPACQVEVAFTDAGLGERVARLEGRLTGEHPNATFVFEAAAGERLRVNKFSGPEIRLAVVRPGGQAITPRLPADLVLNAKGKYTLSVAANSTGQDAFGDFLLEMRLSHAP